MPIDINNIRADRGGDPEKWREYCRKRFKPVELVDKVIELDQQWRKAQYDVEQLKKELGGAQKQVAELKKAKKDAEADEAIKAMAELKASIPAKEADCDKIKATLDKELAKIPNEVDPQCPVSKDENDNRIERTWGECTTREGLLHHHEILTMIDGYEPEKGVGVAGHRAYFLKGNGLLLNQALINYGLSFLMGKEYTPVQPPYFMNKEVMAGIAQLEDFDEQLYKVSGAGEDDEKYLIATSEQPICAFHRGEWLQEKELPKRYAGYSSCFRKEAGSHGKDTWGIFRVHQFEKVEQFIVCEPEVSQAMHKEMINSAEDFYKSLGIPYRVVNIVSGELNNAATMKYDLEGWFPTLARFRELVSASNCTDYQSRAMDVRCGAKKMNEREKKYVHFLNSTLCATTRTICAILENYQQADGVKVPDVLVPYMGGKTFLPFTKEKPNNSLAAKAEKAAAAKPAAAAAGAAADHTPAAPAAAPEHKQKEKKEKPAVAEKKPAAAAADPAPKSAAAAGVSTPHAHAAGTTTTTSTATTTDPASLNSILASTPYLNGYFPSALDAAAFDTLVAAGISEASPVVSGSAAAISAAPGAGLGSRPHRPALPHLLRWLVHMRSFTQATRASWK